MGEFNMRSSGEEAAYTKLEAAEGAGRARSIKALDSMHALCLIQAVRAAYARSTDLCRLTAISKHYSI